MKVTLENVGILDFAEFEIGGLTVICGKNNTGKTYATYSLYGFLLWWNRLLIDTNTIRYNGNIKELRELGTTVIDLEKVLKEIKNKSIEEMGKMYSRKLSDVFSSKPAYFKNSSFSIDIDINEVPKIAFKKNISSQKKEILFLFKKEESSKLQITLLGDNKKVNVPSYVIQDIITDAIGEILLLPLLPRPFITTAERTGSAIFRNELDFARNRLLDEISQKYKLDPFKVLFESFNTYAIPIKKNVDFIRSLEEKKKKESFLVKKREGKKVIDVFADIVGGTYKVVKNQGIYFKPKGKSILLPINESSSAVRSMLDLNFYLHNEAQRGDILMIDEPELNLHPENQRKIARLLARLVNLGIKVFITTHSDYIVKEFSFLVMLTKKETYLKKIREEEGYEDKELLKVEDVKVYIAERAKVKRPENQRKTLCQTLTKVKIDADRGIEMRNFDETIRVMNNIEDEILYGGDE